ncbi:hypothetical protein AgCh_016482 [Apium graveolens]
MKTINLVLPKPIKRHYARATKKDSCLVITPGGGAAPSTPSWILRRCRGVAVVGFLQNNTGRGVGVPRRLRHERVELFLAPSPEFVEFGESGLSPEFVEFGESGLRWLSLAGVEVFLAPSPEFVEFGESGLRWLSLAGVELFLAPSPEFVEFGESGLRWLSLAGVELFLAPSPEFVEFGESGLRWLSLAGVELFLAPSPEFVEFGESGLRWLSLAGVELFLAPSPEFVEFGESGLRFMVRTKALAKAFITCYPGPSSSGSESSADSERVEMGKRASTSDSGAITKLTVAKISSRKVPCSPEGLWVENLGYFVTKSEEIENDFYFRSIRSGYARQENAGPGPYDREAFDRKFANSIVAKEHYELKDEYSGLDNEAQDSAVRAAFQLDRRIEWRWPTPDERAHHRPADGFVPVWPIIQQSSLKFWNGELIMLRGLDLHYLPHIASEGVRTRFRRDVLRGDALRLIFAFCECLGFQMTRDTFMNHRTLHRLGCLPHYNPDMSSSAYSDALKGLGKVFKLPKKNAAGGSGSNSSAEEGSQSNAVPNPEPEVHVTQSTPEHNVELDMGNEFDNLEDLGPIGEVPGADSGRRRKRLRTLGSKPPTAENYEAGSGSGAVKGKAVDVDSPDEDGPGLEEKVARFMAGIPTQFQWSKMNESGFDATMKECSRLWGQLGGYMAGSASLAYNELKISRSTITDKDSEISQLRDQIIVKDNSLSRLNKHLNEVTIRAENAEKEASELKSKLAELRKQMSAVRPESEVVAEFKRSEEYDRALANAGAPEIARCWLIAEKHIKTNPEADWDSFVSEFIKAKEDIELGLGEPEPFDGPCPSFLPPKAPEA